MNTYKTIRRIFVLCLVAALEVGSGIANKYQVNCATVHHGDTALGLALNELGLGAEGPEGYEANWELNRIYDGTVPVVRAGRRITDYRHLQPGDQVCATRDSFGHLVPTSIDDVAH
ncbi:MAG: hypothetical protein ABIG95_04345 [Candidatus Woesearchaeota archaeon]